ncbi:hypothetical protein [Ruminococcus sp.]|uniref:hypothetical protein n=1 Tax=Ruminococcus sp. TaxID=41978 RepID=UPI0025D7A3AE|nr:hypothetical protein [Ruminococcus sp.]
MSVIETQLRPQSNNSLNNEVPISSPFHPLRSAAKVTAKKSFSVLKNTAGKANPFDKPVNKADTADTGTESLKLGYRVTKKTYQAGKKTVRGVKVLYKAPVKTARIAVGTVKLAGSLVVHTAAVLLNPIFWIFLVVLLVVAVFIIPVVLILAGGAGGGSTTNKAYGTAAGVNKDITTAFPEAEEFYKIAAENKQNAFNSMIDSLYYSTDDLSHSNLVYMKCSHDGSEYQTSMATDNRKQQLKDKFSNSLSKAEAIALVYVYLEKQKNDENSTSAQIYEVEFTQQSFDDLLNKMVSWTETTYANQECPQHNCTVHKEEVHNPDWDTAKYNCDTSVNAFYEWRDVIQPLIEHNMHIPNGAAQSQDWDANIGWRIDNWNLVYSSLMGNAYTSNYGYDCLADLDRISDYYIDILNKTPENNVIETVTCDRVHDLHSIGLDIISKDSIMDSWGFDDNYKQWVELTYQGFLNNPNIQD